MAYQYSQNILIGSGTEAMFRIKEFLKSIGWIHQASGDGGSLVSTTAGNANDKITGYATTGAGNWGLGSGWIRLRMPTGNREILMTRSTDTAWLISYSYNAGFTGGSPSATVPPTASDQQGINNTLPNTMSAVTIFSVPERQRLNIIADNAAPYGVLAFGFHGSYSTNASPVFSLVIDPVTNTAAEDVDPYVFYNSVDLGTAVSDISNFQPNSSGSTNVARAWFKSSATTMQFATVYMYTYVTYGSGFSVNTWVALHQPQSNSHIARSIGANPYTGKMNFFPVIWGRPPNVPVSGGNAVYSTLGGSTGYLGVGFKGVSSFFKYPTCALSNGVLLSETTAGDRLVVGQFVVPWNNTPLLI